MPIFSKPAHIAADPATLPSAHAQIRAFLRSCNTPTAPPVIPVHMPNLAVAVYLIAASQAPLFATACETISAVSTNSISVANSLAVEPSTSDVEDNISTDTLVSMPVHDMVETDDDMSWELLYPDSPAPPQASHTPLLSFPRHSIPSTPGPSWSSLFGSDVESDGEQFDNETEAVFVPQPMDEDTAYHFAYHYLASHGSAKHPINVPS
ncbi:hypothetical protein C8F01DRAFT_1083816 [Mycena amicta]|nr:hypothetical protein C8F01DRAFT_1083816 [Mycena amicta]